MTAKLEYFGTGVFRHGVASDDTGWFATFWQGREADLAALLVPSETTAQQDQRESAALEERPVNEPAKGQTDSHQTPSNEDQRAACAEEGSGDSAKAKGPQVASPAAAHLTPREADPYVLLEMYQDDTRFQLCQRIANASLERNQKERENAELRAQLAEALERCEDEAAAKRLTRGLLTSAERQLAEARRLEQARLEHWAEYWNGSRNERAMSDALGHILGQVEARLMELSAALKENGNG